MNSTDLLLQMELVEREYNCQEPADVADNTELKEKVLESIKEQAKLSGLSRSETPQKVCSLESFAYSLMYLERHSCREILSDNPCEGTVDSTKRVADCSDEAQTAGGYEEVSRGP